jgi:hypothetical protein
MVFDMSGPCVLLSPMPINLLVAAGHQLHFEDPSVNILRSFQYMAKTKIKQNKT